MENSMQPYMFMMMSSLQKNSDSIHMYLILMLLALWPTFVKIIPLMEIKDFILDYFNNNNYIHIYIPSHSVPVVRTFSNVAITKVVYSKDFLAIIHYLNTHKICNFNSITEILVTNSDLMVNSNDNQKKENQYTYIPINNKKTLISEKEQIYFELTELKPSNDDGNNEKKDTVKTEILTKKFMINIFVDKKTNNISILKNFIDKCVSEYDIYVDNYLNKSHKQIFEYSSSEKIDSILQLNFKSYKMEHNKSFNNVFLEQGDKEKIIKYLTPFIYDPLISETEGEKKYKACGVTFKAGLFFHGAPGCGKTTTIKAITRFTNRVPIIVNLSKITTCEELEDIFRCRSIKGKTFDAKQLCYILEDCDAFDNSLLKCRNTKIEKVDKDEKTDKSDKSESNILKLLELSSSVSSIKQNVNNDALNLSCFLNILDGIIEAHGIMIIMTSNFPEKIDDAVLRDGRFDFKYKFGKASIYIIKEMLKLKFEVSEEEIEEYIKDKNIPDKILSPAQIQSICFKNDNVLQCIDDIILAGDKLFLNNY